MRRLEQARLVLTPAVIARDQGHVRRRGRRLGPVLRPHRLDRLGARPDEGQAGVAAGPGEGGVLGEKAVAGVDRLRAGARAASRIASARR